MLKLEQSNTYYEPTTCEACSKPTNWGEVITVRVDIVSPTTFNISKAWAHICPECYKKCCF